jgi:hypothetical protein
MFTDLNNRGNTMSDYTVIKTINHPTLKNAEVELAWTYEDTSIAGSFDDDDVKDLERQVDQGDLCWFIARVRILINDKEFGSAYLGGCLYESPGRAFEEGMNGSLEDMINIATTEALVEIKELKEILEEAVS